MDVYYLWLYTTIVARSDEFVKRETLTIQPIGPRRFPKFSTLRHGDYREEPACQRSGFLDLLRVFGAR